MLETPSIKNGRFGAVDQSVPGQLAGAKTAGVERAPPPRRSVAVGSRYTIVCGRGGNRSMVGHVYDPFGAVPLMIFSRA